MKSKQIFIFCFIALGSFFLSCKQIKIQSNQKLPAKYSIVNQPQKITPPNGIKVNDTLFVDETEITNIAWKEYCYHVGKQYGDSSAEYKSTIPNTSGYFELLPSKGLTRVTSKLSKSEYFELGKFDNYPVVGITLEQARKYSKWRSDIVFQMYLIEAGILKPNATKMNTNENPFTREKFLNSRIYRKNQHLINYYPKFFIPARSDIDILKNTVLKNINTDDINSRENAILVQEVTGVPIRKARMIAFQETGNIENLIGNVSELIDAPNLTFGGNYSQSESGIIKFELNEENIPSQYVGFRNFSKWVKI